MLGIRTRSAPTLRVWAPPRAGQRVRAGDVDRTGDVAVVVFALLADVEDGDGAVLKGSGQVTEVCDTVGPQRGAVSHN